MIERPLHSERHPAFPWLWAGCSLALLLSVRESSDVAVSLGIISGSILTISLSTLAEHRRRVFGLGIKIAIFALAIRLFVAILIGVPMPGITLFTLPQINLPELFVGIRVGGPVTSERLSSALTEALVFAAIVIVLSAANALTTPHRLLRVLPYRFYGFGLATTIATSVAPQTSASVLRVNKALRTRGDRSSGLKKARRIVLPVLEESLERSIDLASALEVRGYGHGRKSSRYRPEKWRTKETIALVAMILLSLALPSLNLNSLTEALVVTSMLVAVILL